MKPILRCNNGYVFAAHNRYERLEFEVLHNITKKHINRKGQNSIVQYLFHTQIMFCKVQFKNKTTIKEERKQDKVVFILEQEKKHKPCSVIHKSLIFGKLKRYNFNKVANFLFLTFASRV